MNDWKCKDLVERMKMKAELREVRRQKALSQGDIDFVTSRLLSLRSC